MDFKHEQVARSGVLVMNLGTPQAPTAGAVRRYLRQFLSDSRVIDLPRAIWLPLLYGVVLPFRPGKVAKAYAEVWMEGGSPLLVHSQAIARGIGEQLNLPTELAMCYGQPDIAGAVARLREQGVRRMIVLPLYPQYSATTTAAAFDALAAELSGIRWLPELRIINDYFSLPAYVDALAASVHEHQVDHGRPDKLLFSFHGLPERYWHSGDPYPCQCRATARLVAEKLGLGNEDYFVAFQSQFGKAKWIEPYTNQTLVEWPATGVKHVQVVCPGFSADCLETLEEIALQNRDDFLAAGGETFSYIPALNNRADHVTALSGLVRQHASGWPELAADYDPAIAQQAAQASAERARHDGASQ